MAWGRLPHADLWLELDLSRGQWAAEGECCGERVWSDLWFRKVPAVPGRRMRAGMRQGWVTCGKRLGTGASSP